MLKQKFSLGPLIGLAVFLALTGGVLLIGWRIRFGDTSQYFAYAIAVGIGLFFAHMSIPQHNSLIVALVAGLSAAGSSFGGVCCVAVLERYANLRDLNVLELTSDELLVAREAFLRKSQQEPRVVSFTNFTKKSSFSEDEWVVAEEHWQQKTDAEQESARQEWRSNLAELRRLIDNSVSNVIVSSWYLMMYATSFVIAGGIVVRNQLNKPHPPRGAM